MEINNVLNDLVDSLKVSDPYKLFYLAPTPMEAQRKVAI
jgi:hypothetical protein